MTTLSDVVAEGGRIAEEAAVAGVVLRLMGGVAVSLRCASASYPPLARRYGDIDFAARGGDHKEIEHLFTTLGYEPDPEINTLFSRERLIFFDPDRRRQVDVIVDQLRMCHTIDLRERLERDPVTLTLADLLLTKLQVMQTTEKDYRDVAAILVDHPLGEADGDAIDLDRVVSSCADDWGLWRTVTDVTRRTVRAATSIGLKPGIGRYSLQAQVTDLLTALDEAPKTLRWKVRAKVGDRKRWYAQPDDGKTTLCD